MRIRRFNENQQYLTEPYDPEMETSKVVINQELIDFTKLMFDNLEILSERLGYKHRRDDSCFHMDVSNEKNIAFLIETSYSRGLIEQHFYLKMFIDGKHGINLYQFSYKNDNTFEDVENNIKKFIDK
jgi:hypothetical protein